MQQNQWPDRVDIPLPELLLTVGRVVRRFGNRLDSRTTIARNETEVGRFVVKHATDNEAVGRLQSAIRFHAAVSHPSIPCRGASRRAGPFSPREHPSTTQGSRSSGYQGTLDSPLDR